MTRRFTLTITRSPAQESACKDLKRNGQDRAITPKAAYTPIPKRAGSRSDKKRSAPKIKADQNRRSVRH
ncbi:alpha-galactosidase [Lacticaseibacillus rhamnosus]|uniref:Alpha-galactosidase n=1 Tax=Lacticaseibacillus rhamnosus TaxID=47715 RepID=A0AB74IGW4_LACRH|nr:alpha-galactosidase [Lacticaseibacillus rhamnosus]MCT3149380.1 alpha-galactosidase [Lacticaseibacillus rhamnosus]MCT3156269.1 alpha-galactosidase [Lacticaseibacillus rhamnosus]MCT3157920.1 alpha-galactosidase [Lacticaseibacillus rhamnosus]MCT3186206.1 alpha-galactosidase [Lacticaseibacillus rhamnosus]